MTTEASSSRARSVAPPTPASGRGRGSVDLVGRDDEVATLEAEIDRVVGGSLRVVLVTGAAGIGKTRLVSEAVLRRRDRLTVLSARAYRWGSTTSLAPWIEALDRNLRAGDAPEHEDLRQLVDGLAAREDAGGSTGGRGLLLGRLVTILDRLAAERPLALILDDVHLADASSWEALRFVARRLPDAPIGVFASARTSELRGNPLAREVLVGLADDGLLVRLPLRPLTRPQIATLAHEVLRTEPEARSTFVPEPLVSWLVDRSLGHPLFVIGLLRAVVRERADLARPRLERIPEGLRERVALELGDLEAEDRALLDLLAVLDLRVPAIDLVGLSDRSLEDVAAGLERLTAPQLVAEHVSDADVRYEVAHPIVQECVYEGIGGARRQALHRTVARRLFSDGQLGSAAAHFARAARPGDAEAIDALCRAAHEAQSRGMYREVLAALDALLDVLPAGDERWLRVLETMDWQSEWVLSHLAEGDAETAITATERIGEVLETRGDDAARAVVEFHRASFLSFGAGRIVEAERACRRALELFEAVDDREGALTARTELAWIRGCAGDLVGHAELAAEAFSEAVELDLTSVAVQAAGCGAYALGATGRFAAAEERFGRAAELAEEEGNTYRSAWAHAQRGLVLGLAGRPEEGVRSAALALETDPMAPDAVALEDLAHSYWLLGRLEEATEALGRSAARRPLQGSRRRAWGAALAARLYGEMGQLGRARRTLEVVAGTYGEAPMLTWGCWPPWTEGFLRWQEGETADAIDQLEATADRIRRTGAAPYEGLVLTDLAEVAVDAGARDHLEEAADRVATIAEEIGGGLLPALALLVGAWRDLAAGDHDPSAAGAAEAAGALEAAGCDLHRATALTVVGLACGQEPRAVEALDEAARLLDRCGAVWRRDRVLAVLRRQGSRGQRAAGEVQGPGALTGREREVAELAARGYTAREMGERLFISHRTVETHLANAYAKLGVASKRELVRRADELDLR